MGGERHGAPGGVAPQQGIGPSGFERNGVDRIPEAERTSTPGTFFVVFVGGSVGLGAIAFGWLGMYFGLGLWATISAIAVGTIVGPWKRFVGIDDGYVAAPAETAAP